MQDDDEVYYYFGQEDDDVGYNIGERPKLEGETENMGVCTKKRDGMTAEILMATPCTKSLGYGSVGGTSVQEVTISHMTI